MSGAFGRRIDGTAFEDGSRMLRLATVGLVGGGLLMADLRSPTEAAGLQEITAAREVQWSVAERLAEAVATSLRATLEERGWSLEPAADGSGFAFRISDSGEDPVDFAFTGLAGILDKVARGEMRFTEVSRDGEADQQAPPEWVPVYPGVRTNMSFSVETADFVLGGSVFVADASAARILDWYHDWADRREPEEEPGFVGRTLRYPQEDLPVPGPGDLGRFALLFDLWSVVVFVTEDDHRGSLFVVLHKKFAEPDKA